MQNYLKFTTLLCTTLALLLPFTAGAKSPAASGRSILEDGGKPPPELLPFIPSGWLLRARVRGDLNADGRDDWVIVLEGDDPSKRSAQKFREVNTNPRRFVVLVRDAKQPHGYRHAGASDRLIPPAADELPSGESGGSCSEDPLHGITIRNRVITITFAFWSSCGSWSRSEEQYRFRMEPGQGKELSRVRLIGVERIEGSRAHGEYTALNANFLTGKKQRTDVTLAPETRRKTKASAISDVRPLYLEDMDKAGECYEENSKAKASAWCQ